VVSSPSLGEEEECVICADALELNKCSRSVSDRSYSPIIPVTQRLSLPCQHIFCNVCLSKLSGGESISCPQCRGPTNIESLEQVEVTATQQWDNLLELAQQFAAMEWELGPDTSEEEEEEKLREHFIDDGDTESRFVVGSVRDTFRVLTILQFFVIAVLLTIQCLMQFRKTDRSRMRQTMANRDTFHIQSLEWLRRESGCSN
jgi:hypothetical protein